jgi:hypothetical protein
MNDIEKHFTKIKPELFPHYIVEFYNNEELIDTFYVEFQNELYSENKYGETIESIVNKMKSKLGSVSAKLFKQFNLNTKEEIYQC